MPRRNRVNANDYPLVTDPIHTSNLLYYQPGLASMALVLSVVLINRSRPASPSRASGTPTESVLLEESPSTTAQLAPPALLPSCPPPVQLPPPVCTNDQVPESMETDPAPSTSSRRDSGGSTSPVANTANVINAARFATPANTHNTLTGLGGVSLEDMVLTDQTTPSFSTTVSRSTFDEFSS